MKTHIVSVADEEFPVWFDLKVNEAAELQYIRRKITRQKDIEISVQLVRESSSRIKMQFSFGPGTKKALGISD